MADINDPREYDPPERYAPEPDDDRCKHGKDPRNCEDVDCLIAWHYEHDRDDM